MPRAILNFVPSNWEAVKNHAMVRTVNEDCLATRIEFSHPDRYSLTVTFAKRDHKVQSLFLCPYNNYDEKTFLEDVASWLGTTPTMVRRMLGSRG